MDRPEAERLVAAVIANFGKCVCLPKRICTCGVKQTCDCELGLCPGHRFLREHQDHLAFAISQRDHWMRGEGIKFAPPPEPPQEERLPW